MKRVKKVIYLATGVLLSITILAMVASAYPASTVSLKAEVRFDGQNFIIVNKDHFPWKNVRMELNSPLSLFSFGYILWVKQMIPNKVYTFHAGEFCKKDGTRFNPLLIKPLNFAITCEAYASWRGEWYGEWK